MKTLAILLFAIPLFLFTSCEKKEEEKNYVLDDSIIAGQKYGAGIEYVDLKPDTYCAIADPFENTETTISFDFNKDDIEDFLIKGSVCSPYMLGASCESFTIVPLHENEICTNATSTWVDTLPSGTYINAFLNWSSEESVIYSYTEYQNSSRWSTGYWNDVSSKQKYFIGFKIMKDKKAYYGWIAVKTRPSPWFFTFYLTEYGILKDYEKN